MKRIILFFSLLVFAGTTLAMEIGIIKQFNNRRPALGRFKVDNIDLQDFNQDGTPEITTWLNDSLYVIDPLTKVTLWQFDLRTMQPPPSSPDFNFYGFMMSDGKLISHAIIAPRDTVSGLPTGTYIIDIQTGATDFFMDGAKPMAVLQRPNNGKQVLVAKIDTWEHAIVIIGDTGGNNTAVSIASDGSGQLHGSAGDYQLELKFQADPGLRLAYDPDLFDPVHDMDIDGDEYLDIPMLIENTSNELVGVVVRGGDDFDVLWQFPFPAEHKENILKGFFGFVDANGDGEKEAILGENLAVTLDGTVHTIAENFVTLDVNDIDGDGYEDIIGLNTVDSTIVVYGRTSPTSVSEPELATKIHFQLFPNYPNPFNPSTTISYSVAEAGAVELTVYNQLGRAVRTLFSGQKPAGEYTLKWDGRDNVGRSVSSGQYFYRLKLGKAVQSRRMLVLK